MTATEPDLTAAAAVIDTAHGIVTACPTRLAALGEIATGIAHSTANPGADSNAFAYTGTNALAHGRTDRITKPQSK